MDRLIRYMGPAGLILIVIGGIIYGVMYTSGWPAVLPLLAGLVLSISALVMSYRRSRSEGARRSARYGIGTGVAIIVTAAILIFLQTISTRHSIRIDTTGNKRFSLSPQTVKVLSGLQTEISFTCFFKEATPEMMQLQDLLSEYGKVSPRIDFRFVDPDKDPITARRYGLDKYGSVFVEAGGRKEEVAGLTEEKITNAIYRMVSIGIKAVYFTSGHGEKTVSSTEPEGYSGLVESITLENYDVRELSMTDAGGIPEDCRLLIIAGPRADILKAEQNMILDYLTLGGKALFLLDPVADIRHISGITSAYGIEPGDDIVIDHYGNMLTGNYLTPVINQYGTHPITEDFRLFSFFPQARSLRISVQPPNGVTVTAICRTNQRAYAESSIDTLMIAGKTQYVGGEDLPGPITIGAVGELIVEVATAGTGDSTYTSVSRIAVFGDSDFAGNSNLKLSGNRDLVMNTVNWLTEEEDLIAIRPGDSFSQPVLLSVRQGSVVFWLPVVGLPALVALTGILLFVRKRRSV